LTASAYTQQPPTFQDPCDAGVEATTTAFQDLPNKVATMAEASKQRKDITKLKHMHATTGLGGEQW
jgi:hypothetical protein